MSIPDLKAQVTAIIDLSCSKEATDFARKMLTFVMVVY